MTVAIRLENVSKKFSLERLQPRSWQETILNFFHRRSQAEKEEELFWVLDDISFEVYQGETFSFIGANGAGKSTLFKLLTRIVRPTRGRIQITGRISALLELGTGFHPDLTGRENIYGTLAGLSRSEINQNIKNIIDFADIGRFIDMPVRHYSSGMFVRLGFALATHINPDILIVDEVLAVGDASFQKKCIEKIHETRYQGVTVLLVSHDMSVIRSISDRVLWLKDGRVEAAGDPGQVIQAYLADQRQVYDADHRLAHNEAHLDKSVEIEQVEFLNGQGQAVPLLETGCRATIRIKYIAHRRVERPIFGLAIYASDGVHINGPNTELSNFDITHIEGRGTIEYQIDRLPLLAGIYYVTVGIFNHNNMVVYDYCDQAFSFSVKQINTEEIYGVVYMPAQWRHIQEDRTVSLRTTTHIPKGHR